MGLFRPSRTRRGPDPYYDWKVALFTAGAAVGLTGIFTNHDALVLLAMPILVLGVILRWLPRPGARQRSPEPEDSAHDGEEAESQDEAADRMREQSVTAREQPAPGPAESAPPDEKRLPSRPVPPPQDERTPEDGAAPR